MKKDDPISIGITDFKNIPGVKENLAEIRNRLDDKIITEIMEEEAEKLLTERGLITNDYFVDTRKEEIIKVMIEFASPSKQEPTDNPYKNQKNAFDGGRIFERLLVKKEPKTAEELNDFFDFYKSKFGVGFQTDVLEITINQFKECKNQ